MGDKSLTCLVIWFLQDSLTEPIKRSLRKYVSSPDFDPVAVGAVSQAAKALCLWIHALVVFTDKTAEIEPKRKRAEEAKAVRARCDALNSTKAQAGEHDANLCRAGGQRLRKRAKPLCLFSIPPLCVQELAVAQQALSAKQAELRALLDKLEALRQRYDASVAKKEVCRCEPWHYAMRAPLAGVRGTRALGGCERLRRHTWLIRLSSLPCRRSLRAWRTHA